MANDLQVIAEKLYNTQQTIVGLTEQDYDPTPIVATMQQDVKVQIDIKIESQAMSGDSMIWGHPTRGVWGAYKWSDSASVGFILGHPIYGRLGFSQLGTNAAAWETVEELINI
jgi:hypothetical protein